MKEKLTLSAIKFITLGTILGTIFGFSLGFFRGETVYIWAFEGSAVIFWTALSGIGTLIVAIVSVCLTYEAIKVAKQAAENDKKIQELEEAEFAPFIDVVEFIGYSDDNMGGVNKEISKPDFFVGRGKIKDKEEWELMQVLSIPVSTMHPGTMHPGTKHHCRVYFFHLKYLGKSNIEKVTLKRVLFKEVENRGVMFEKEFIIGSDFKLSLFNEKSFKFHLRLYDEGDFRNNCVESNKLLKSNQIHLEVEMTATTNKKHEAKITIYKLYLPVDGNIHAPDEELLLSSSFTTMRKREYHVHYKRR